MILSCIYPLIRHSAHLENAICEINIGLARTLKKLRTSKPRPKKNSTDVASDVGVNFKNVGVLSIESSLFHLFHYTFLQTKHLRKGY